VVARGAPFHNTLDAATNPLPFIVRLNAADPAAIEDGETVVMTGVGLLIVKLEAAETPPPGAGFVTVTVAAPAVARSATAMAAVNCVALMNVVLRALPFHWTTDAATNPPPVTVSVSAPEATFAEAGRIDATTGAGFGVMVNVAPAEAPPPGAGLTTVTVAVPALARSAAVMAAVSCEALTKVVARLVPFHWIWEAATNPLPLAVTKNRPELIAADAG
jgi:hypothetical protein